MMMLRRASEKRLQSQMGTSRSVACDHTLSVDRDLDATNVSDKTTWMLRAQPWLTVVD